MPAHLEFLPRLVKRSPVLPLNLCIDEPFILNLLNHDWFKDAIYIASPVLYDAALKMQKESLKLTDERKKIISSLTRYYLRMNSRATPFGLFSGVSVAEWGEKTVNTTDRKYIPRARMDMHFIALFLQYLLSFDEFKRSLTYFVNSSLYKVGDEFRYVEYTYTGINKTHAISAIDQLSYLQKIFKLAKDGAAFHDIIAKLIADGVSTEDAAAYVGELVDSQVLISELELSVTGEDALQPILKILYRTRLQIKNKEILEAISKIELAYNELNTIPAKKATLSEIFGSVKDTLSGLDFEFNNNRLVQLDCVQGRSVNDTLDIRMQQEIRACIDILGRMKGSVGNKYLDRFKELFVQKYEDQEIQLLLALDTETGIDYMGQTDKLESLVIPETGFNNKEESNVELDKLSQLLLQQLINCQQDGNYTFSLEDLELEKVDIDLPPSFSVIFQVINNKKNQLYIEQIGGVSATNLIGRFTTLNDNIFNIGKDIITRDSINNPEVIYAGIVHLPDDRMGNILFRRQLTAYEIPYLGKSNLQKEFQIPANDLYVSVRNNTIVLRSRSLNAVIVPRLLSAYNYNKSSLPVFHFLCHLQSQNYHAELGFNWGKAAHLFKFLPRVIFRQHILYPATWQFKKADIQNLYKSRDLLETTFKDFRAKWKIPRFFKLTDDDHELLIDSENNFLLNNFIQLIKQREDFVITEFIQPDSVYMDQYIAAVVNNKPTADNRLINKQSSNEEIVAYDLGSSWMYLKVYCNITTADKILVNCIYPVVKELLAANLINKWFFVRYTDESFHLRIRFKLNDPKDTGHIISLFNDYIVDCRQNGSIWKVQTDTYIPEFNRYGYKSMETSETIFHEQSTYILELLTAGIDDEMKRWLYGMRYVNSLLDDLKYNTQCKLSFVKGVHQGYSDEFNLEKSFRNEANKTYKLLLPQFIDNMNDDNTYEMGNPIKIIYDLHSSGELEVDLEELLSSYLHMFFNRLFVSHNRLHELVIYDFLMRVYNLIIHKSLATT